MDWMIAMTLKPFMLFAILAVFGVPIVVAVKRWLPNSKFKQLLLDRDLVNRYPGLPYFVGLLGILWVLYLMRGL